MRYWKVMAGTGSHYVNEWVEKKVIAVGFANVEAAAQARTADAMRRLVAEVRPEASRGQVASAGSQLFRFYNEMKRGDRVLVYDPSTRLYHVGEITSDPEFKQKEQLPHVRRVKWLHSLSRDALTVATKNTLGGIMTLFAISDDARKEIETRLLGKAAPAETLAPEEETSEVKTLGGNVLEQSQEFIKDAIVKLDAYPLQDLVAGLLRAMGYKTRVSPPGADRGKDIIASPDGLGLEEPRIIVQVKGRRDTQMDAKEIRAFAGILRGAKGIYVSTGGFSKDARYEAERSESPVALVDTDELAALIIQYYDQCDADTRTLLPLRKMYWPLS